MPCIPCCRRPARTHRRATWTPLVAGCSPMARGSSPPLFSATPSAAISPIEILPKLMAVAHFVDLAALLFRGSHQRFWEWRLILHVQTHQAEIPRQGGDDHWRPGCRQGRLPVRLRIDAFLEIGSISCQDITVSAPLMRNGRGPRTAWRPRWTATPGRATSQPKQQDLGLFGD